MKKLQYRKFGITGLESSLKATEKHAYCLGYLHFTSRYGFPKLNATYDFYLKKWLKQNYRQEFLKCTFLPAELEFDVCCKAINQNFDCGCDHCAILHLDSLTKV